MVFIFSIIIVLVGLLLLTYYKRKANNDDLNRPTFFNNKIRKYSLLALAVFLFVFGEVLLIYEGYGGWALLVPLVYYVSYYFIKAELSKDLIISRIFKYYKVFSGQEVNLSDKERLIAPVDFMMSLAKFPEDFHKKAHAYIEKRFDDGKIKDVRDLPVELNTILQSIGEKEIVEKSNNVLSEEKIDYYYKTIIKGENHSKPTSKIMDMLWYIEAKIEHLFPNFSFICLSRPNFSCEEMDLTEHSFHSKGEKDHHMILPTFSNVPGSMAYSLLANLNFYFT